MADETAFDRWQKGLPYHIDRKAVVLAPDAYFTINESSAITVCPTCQTKAEFMPYVTSISTSLDVSDAASATINLSIPRFKVPDFYKSGQVAFTRMDQVSIYMKTRFLGADGNPQYAPVFWGIVSSVSYSESNGALSVTLSCKGILYWWEITTYILNPSAADSRGYASSTAGRNTILHGMNPYQIIQALSEDFRAATLPTNTGMDNTARRVGLIRGVERNPSALFQIQAKSVLQGWESVFNSMKDLIRMYGITFEKLDMDLIEKDVSYKAVDGMAQAQKQQEAYAKSPMALARKRVSGSPGDTVMTLDPDMVNLVMPLGALDSSDKKETVSKSRLEIARDAKKAINYEFYMDTTGEIMFKPPFYNLDVKGRDETERVTEYIIEDADILSWSFTESEDGIVTRVEVTGDRCIDVPGNPAMAVFGMYEDPNLSRRYGQRVKQVQVPYLKTAASCDFYAKAEMGFHSMGQYAGSVRILGRPELRLGIPVYFPARDTYAYITNIQHEFTFGGSFTTNLGLTAFRRKYRSFEKKELDSKPNVVAKMEYKEVTITQEVTTNVDGKDVKGESTRAVMQGNWEETQWSSPLYQAMGTYKDAKDQPQSPVVPVSDENGYELIGAFPYGRGIKIDPFTGEMALRQEALDSFRDSQEQEFRGILSRDKDSKTGQTDLAAFTLRHQAVAGSAGVTVKQPPAGDQIVIKTEAPKAEGNPKTNLTQMKPEGGAGGQTMAKSTPVKWNDTAKPNLRSRRVTLSQLKPQAAANNDCKCVKGP